MLWSTHIRWFLLLPLLVGLIAEGFLRIAIDIRLYSSDNAVGYWVQPSQKGAGFLTGSFAVNRSGLLVEEEFQDTGAGPNALLVGDSIVLGINGLPQSERLGPLLSREADWRVWPLGAGSWSLSNEIRFLEREKTLEGMDCAVFVVNSGDIAPPSAWDNEYIHPTREPTSYLRYILWKLVDEKFASSNQKSITLSGDLEGESDTFVKKHDIPIAVIGYDTEPNTNSKCQWAPNWLKVENFSCLSARQIIGESGMVDRIHPNAVGNRKLARSIAQNIRQLGICRSRTAS